MVPNTDRLLERYIEGLPLNIKGNVTSSKPVDLHEAIEMAQGLMYQVVQELGENSGDKKKWNGNHYNHNNTNHASNLNPNKRPKAARVFIAGQGSYIGKLPYCGKCGRHHTNACPPTCHNCGRAGHKVKDCRAPPRLTSQIGPGNQEDREVMSLVSDVARRDITRTSVQTMEIKAKETKIEATLKRAPRRFYSLCGESCGEDNNVVNGERKYINLGCQVFLIQMMKEEETEIPKRRIKDVPIVKDFSEVFPEDFARISLTRQVEFHIELIPGAAPVARAPYRLAPAENERNLPSSSKRAFDKGFYKTKFLLRWEPQSCFVKKKDGSFLIGIDYRELNTLT
ncbi:putative reverse transcriptase domain-containing protein [Tanacetum coccineum]